MTRGHVPVRTCVGCRSRHPKSDLVRFVADDGRIRLGGVPGRGRYLCRSLECLSRALQRRGPTRLSEKVLGTDGLAALRRAVADAGHGACGASGGGAIG